MRAYKRAAEKRMHLISALDYTIDSGNENEGKTASTRTKRKTRRAQRGVISNHPDDHGNPGNQPRRGRSKNGGSTIQHQQGDASEICSHSRFPCENCRESWNYDRFEDHTTKRGAA